MVEAGEGVGYVSSWIDGRLLQWEKRYQSLANEVEAMKVHATHAQSLCEKIHAPVVIVPKSSTYCRYATHSGTNTCPKKFRWICAFIEYGIPCAPSGQLSLGIWGLFEPLRRTNILGVLRSTNGQNPSLHAFRAGMVCLLWNPWHLSHCFLNLLCSEQYFWASTHPEDFSMRQDHFFLKQLSSLLSMAIHRFE